MYPNVPSHATARQTCSFGDQIHETSQNGHKRTFYVCIIVRLTYDI